MSDTVGAAGAIAVICIAAGVSGATMATTTVHRTTMARASASPSEADATIITAIIVITAAATERSDRNGPASAGPFCCPVYNWLSPVVAAFKPAVAVLNLRGASDPQSSARHRSAINRVKAKPTRA
jgi:hypothetical protein